MVAGRKIMEAGAPRGKREKERAMEVGSLPPSSLRRTTTTGVIATVRDRFPLPPT